METEIINTEIINTEIINSEIIIPEIISPEIIYDEVGYIYCRARNGLNDSLNQLYLCTLYAIKHNYHIILEFSSYNSLEITKIFNFINYPVVIYPSSKLKQMKILRTEPEHYLPHIYNKVYKPEQNIRFDQDKIYSKDI